MWVIFKVCPLPNGDGGGSTGGGEGGDGGSGGDGGAGADDDGGDGCRRRDAVELYSAVL